jgi:peptidoglycan/LPS O-acetylase OafA/YrhL
MTVAPSPSRSRVDVFDGIRGLAILIVVLSHTWIVAPMPEPEALRILFTSGNYAVSIFFVVGGFLATLGMLRQLERPGPLRFGVLFIRRWLRLSSQVYPLVVAVLALTAIDRNMLTYEMNNTRESAWRIVTYTWNGYVRTNPYDARPDLGHLWYVCTDLWVIGLILVLVFLLGRRRVALFVALAAITVLVMIYRQHVFSTEGLFPALTRVQTRADGLLWGAMAAVALPWCRRFASLAPRVGAVSVLALVPLMWAVNDSAQYFGFAGWLLNLALALFAISSAVSEPQRRIREMLSWQPLATLGRYSLVLYVWHFPIFWYLSRNTSDWSWGWRAAVGYGATVVIALLAQVVIERPVQRWLSSGFWTPFQRGLLGGTRDHLAAAYTRVRERRRATRTREVAPVRDLEDQL